MRLQISISITGRCPSVATCGAKLNFYQMQRALMRETPVDGETFALQVRSKDKGLQLQLLKTDAIEDSSTFGSEPRTASNTTPRGRLWSTASLVTMSMAGKR